MNQRPEVLWIRTGFDLRQTWAIASTYQLFETVGLQCQLECKAILDPHNQTVGTSDTPGKVASNFTDFTDFTDLTLSLLCWP